MSKPWSYDDDMWLVDFFEIVGDMVGPHDLGRPKGSATKRVAKLKSTGVWEAMKAAKAAEDLARSKHAMAFSKDRFVREMAEETLSRLEVSA